MKRLRDTELPSRAMMRFVRPRVLLGISSLAVLAVLAAGCGGGGGGSSDTESAQDWADGLCSALNTWTDSLKSAGQSLSSGNLSKSSLESAGNDVKDATAQLKDDLNGLGKPELSSGDKAQQSVDDLSNKIQEDVDKVDGAIKDAQSGGSVLSALPTVTSTFAAMGAQVQATFDDLKKLDPQGELESAFNNASSCKSLTSQKG
jgi:hypothetical protein